MISFPNSKINLGLNVVEKRLDGFHNLETLFYPIYLCDALELTKNENSKSYMFSASGLALDTSSDGDNIVIKAFELLKSKFDLPAIVFHLHKRIPFGAGLGGGSSDGAFAIRLINELCNLGMDDQLMEKYAAELGSDCPFFIRNKPVYAEGRGELFRSVDLDLSDYYVLLVKPNFSINTKLAFNGIVPRKSEISLIDVCNQPISEWKRMMKNDFEATIFPFYPELKKIKQQLYDMGALYAAMSGSGSTMYGIFREKPDVIPFNKEYFTWTGRMTL